MKNQLIKYIRDKHKTPKGVVVAFNENGVVHIGWSLCSNKDEWNKELGFKIACNRAYAYVDKEEITVAQSAAKDLVKMVGRAEAFFKTAEKFPLWTKR